MVERPRGGIEQARRNLMRDDPNLYAYIEALTVARALKRAGGDASGALDQYGAANRIWALSGRWTAIRDEIRQRDDHESGEEARRTPRG